LGNFAKVSFGETQYEHRIEAFSPKLSMFKVSIFKVSMRC
jgi:hypothetical protein